MTRCCICGASSEKMSESQAIEAGWTVLESYSVKQRPKKKVKKSLLLACTRCRTPRPILPRAAT